MTLLNTGFAGAALLFATVNHVGLGKGTTAAAATDTTLETECTETGLTRQPATVSQETTTVTGDTHQLLETFTNSSGGTVAVTEAGMFADLSGGTMYDHQVFSAVNIEDGNSLQVTYQIKFSA